MFQGSHLDLNVFIFQESLQAWEQILLSVFWTQDLRQFVNWGRQSFLDSVIIDFCQFVVEGLEPSPFIRTEDIHECWEIEACVVAYIFILTGFSGIHVEIYDLWVNIAAFVECADEGSDVLESSASDQFWGWIFQESIIYLAQFVGLLFNAWDFCNFRHLISASFPHSFLFVQGQIIVEWENLVVEEIEADDFGDVEEVFGHGDSYAGHLIDTKGIDLRNNKALSESLTHILSKFIQNFECRASVLAVVVVGEFQCQIHNVIFLVILDNRSNIQQDANSLILNNFLWII